MKGHGTENDFVVLPPGAGPAELGAGLVRALCDRRRGIGADGVLRVVPVDAHGGGDPDVRWLMDYRNADGGIAEMCGNGIRVFARFLVTEGLEQPGRLRIATRDGVKTVDVPVVGDVTVDMGVATPLPDAKVQLATGRYDGIGWSMGNPHLVVLDVADVAAIDLTSAPTPDPVEAFPDGVNVEFVQRLDDRRVRMRVHERGVGETRSCGTGACAAAVAAMAQRAERTSYDVEVPGGTLQVEWKSDGAVLLTGPAVLVAEGEVDERLARS
ncbi:MAG: diaminopimelate epimerase [Frankiaceae bacterium]|nr:diaminopimelate epimerase [Frankiaceae bacterium]